MGVDAYHCPAFRSGSSLSALVGVGGVEGTNQGEGREGSRGGIGGGRLSAAGQLARGTLDFLSLTFLGGFHMGQGGKRVVKWAGFFVC